MVITVTPDIIWVICYKSNCHSSTNEKLSVGGMFSESYGLTIYGSGRRKGVVNQWLEFALIPQSPPDVFHHLRQGQRACGYLNGFNCAIQVDFDISRSLHNNNNEYLERLTRTGPKRLHVFYKYIFVKIECIQHECTHTRTHTHRRAHARMRAHARAHTHTHTHTHTPVASTTT